MATTKKIKKDLRYYLNLDWTYTIETESHKGKKYYIIHVNELPGVCTDGETLEEGMRDIQEAIEAAIALYIKREEEIPEPVNTKLYKGNIAYRTSSNRHYQLVRAAERRRLSVSKMLDQLVDTALLVPELAKPIVKRKKINS